MLNSFADTNSKLLTNVFQLFKDNKLNETEKLFLKKQIFKETSEIREIIKCSCGDNDHSIKNKLLNLAKSATITSTNEHLLDKKKRSGKEENRKKTKNPTTKKSHTDHRIPEPLFTRYRSDSEGSAKLHPDVKKNLGVKVL